MSIIIVSKTCQVQLVRIFVCFFVMIKLPCPKVTTRYVILIIKQVSWLSNKFHNRILHCSFQSSSIGFIRFLHAQNVKFYFIIMNCFHCLKFFFIHGFSTTWSFIVDTVITCCTIIDRVYYRSRCNVMAQVLNDIATSSVITKSSSFTLCVTFSTFIRSCTV